MASPPFSEGQLRFFMRKADVRAFRLGDSEAEVLESIVAARDSLNSPNYAIAFNNPFLRGKELVYEPARFEDKLFLRHLNCRLCRAYKIRPPNRNEIAREIQALLKADAHLNIVRADIRRFFRNVNFTSLLDQLRIDGLVSVTEINALVRIAEFTARFQPRGIPWGLSVSSTLAEIYLRDFDADIRATSHVYYYRRFVDDMIAFTSDPAPSLLKRFEQSLRSKGLKLNCEKTIAISEAVNRTAEFNYLGYRFARGQMKRRKPNIVTIAIADAKIRRLRQRIDESFDSFYKSPDVVTLRDRIMLLTGNYSIEKSSHDAPIRTGIYYNYPEITSAKTQLADMDKFLRSRLVGLRAYFTRRADATNARHVRGMMAYSFLCGFEKKILHRFSQLRLEKLCRVWTE